MGFLGPSLGCHQAQKVHSLSLPQSDDRAPEPEGCGSASCHVGLSSRSWQAMEEPPCPAVLTRTVEVSAPTSTASEGQSRPRAQCVGAGPRLSGPGLGFGHTVRCVTGQLHVLADSLPVPLALHGLCRGASLSLGDSRLASPSGLGSGVTFSEDSPSRPIRGPHPMVPVHASPKSCGHWVVSSFSLTQGLAPPLEYKRS